MQHSTAVYPSPCAKGQRTKKEKQAFNLTASLMPIIHGKNELGTASVFRELETRIEQQWISAKKHANGGNSIAGQGLKNILVQLERFQVSFLTNCPCASIESGIHKRLNRLKTKVSMALFSLEKETCQ